MVVAFLMGDGEPVAELTGLGADGGDSFFVALAGQYLVEPAGDLDHVIFGQPAGCESRGADADTAGLGGFSGIKGDQVLIDDNTGVVEPVFGLGAGQIGMIGPQIHQVQVVVRAAGAELKTLAEQGFGQGFAVINDLLGVDLEFGFEGLSEGDGLGGDDVTKRAALHGRKNGGIHLFGILLLAHRDTGARAAKGFVGGGGDKIANRQWIGMQAGADQTGDMGDVGHDQSAIIFSDLDDFIEFQGSRVGAGAANDEFGFVLSGQGAHLVVVDSLGIGMDAVTDNVVEFPAEIEF